MREWCLVAISPPTMPIFQIDGPNEFVRRAWQIWTSLSGGVDARRMLCGGTLGLAEEVEVKFVPASALTPALWRDARDQVVATRQAEPMNLADHRGAADARAKPASAYSAT